MAEGMRSDYVIYDEIWWWREALCTEIGPDLFFVAEGQSVAEAKEACLLCPVRLECLADSLEADVEYGIFGGFARPVRRVLAEQVKNGADPMRVAARAIEKERKRNGTRHPDHRDHLHARRARAAVRTRPT